MRHIQPSKCISLYYIWASSIQFCMLSYVLNITVGKKEHAGCFSNAVLGILNKDSVSFRSSGTVLGLRVHNSVRYNYEKLIPGKPVWHFIHDVSYGYLINFSAPVHSNKCECTDVCAHTHNAPTHKLADIPKSLEIVEGALYPWRTIHSLTHRHTHTFTSHCLAFFWCALERALPQLIH